MRPARGSAPRRPILGGTARIRPGVMATDVKHKFDAESGQVFVEHEVPFKKQHSDWIGEPKSPSLLKKQNPNGHGARSLADMAKIKVALSFSTLSSEHFAAIPWALAERVWEELVSMYEP